MKNSKGKLTILGLDLLDENGKRICVFPVPFKDGKRDYEPSTENIKRLAAAWNATLNVPIEILEDGYVLLTAQKNNATTQELKVEYAKAVIGSLLFISPERLEEVLGDLKNIEINKKLEEANVLMFKMLKQFYFALENCEGRILQGSIMHDALKRLLADIEEGK